MTSCQWPNPRRLTQVLRCHYHPPLFLRGATMRSFFWIGLSLCIFTVCTKSALAHRPNLSSARDQAAARQSEPVGGPFQGICSSTTAFGSNAMANCDSTVLPHNETAVAVDPNNPAHLLAGSNDTELVSGTAKTRVGYFLHPHNPRCVTPPFCSRDAGH